MKRQFFTTGETIPATGIYQEKHRRHKLLKQAVFLQGSRFPGCLRCERIVFELLQAAPHIFSDPDFLVLPSKELPVRVADEGLRKDKSFRKIL